MAAGSCCAAPGDRAARFVARTAFQPVQSTRHARMLQGGDGARRRAVWRLAQHLRTGTTAGAKRARACGPLHPTTALRRPARGAGLLQATAAAGARRVSCLHGAAQRACGGPHGSRPPPQRAWGPTAALPRPLSPMRPVRCPQRSRGVPSCRRGRGACGDCCGRGCGCGCSCGQLWPRAATWLRQ